MNPSSDINMTEFWSCALPLLSFIIIYIPTRITLVTIGWLKIDSLSLKDTVALRALAE